MTLFYHNHFGTYCGETPHDVLRAVYDNALKEAPKPFSYEEWRAYNVRLWKSLYDISIPQGDTAENEQAFLDALMTVGALSEGTAEEHQT